MRLFSSLCHPRRKHVCDHGQHFPFFKCLLLLLPCQFVSEENSSWRAPLFGFFVVNGDGAIAKISWTTGSFHWFPCFVQGLPQQAGHCRHPSERCPAPLPLFPWTLGMRQTLEKRFIKEWRMAISSSPASPDRGENRLRELLESETIMWGGSKSYSGIESIAWNKAEDLHYLQIFCVSEHINCSGSSQQTHFYLTCCFCFLLLPSDILLDVNTADWMRKWVALHKSTSKSCSASQRLTELTGWWGSPWGCVYF